MYSGRDARSTAHLAKMVSVCRMRDSTNQSCSSASQDIRKMVAGELGASEDSNLAGAFRSGDRSVRGVGICVTLALAYEASEDSQLPSSQ